MHTMSKVPAWKRLGLQVKSEVEDDPLATTVHLENDTLTNKLAKKLNKKRKLQETKSEVGKKPPKRAKLPKPERGPPPEKDQLAYLRQFSKDKANWKFSKQKQNWLLKNIEGIPESYEAELIEYIEGIQGGARDRIAAELRAVVEKWNEYGRKLEEKIEAELYGDGAEKTEETTTEGEEKAGPSKEYAARCVKILRALEEEVVEFFGEHDEEEKEEKAEENDENEKEVAEDADEQKEDDGNDAEDNLIIEEVHAEDYESAEKEEAEKPKKKSKKAKASKKVRIVTPN